MHWIIENIWDGDTERLVKAIKDNDAGTVEILETSASKYWDFFSKYQGCDEDTIVFGSIQLCKYTRGIDLAPGAIFEYGAYDCLRYYKYLHMLLLNNDYKILPFYSLKHKIDEIYGEERDIFIRPNSPNKPFTGQVIGKERFVETIDRFSWDKDLQNEELCFISAATNIQCEYRCVVTKNGFLTGSLYRDGTVHKTSEEVPEEVIALATKASQMYLPDPIYLVDISTFVGRPPKVIEIGPIACAGFYDCDRSKIVNYIKEDYGI
jgi:hypothetical protein